MVEDKTAEVAGRRKLAAFAFVVEEQAPEDSEVDPCLRQF